VLDGHLVMVDLLSHHRLNTNDHLAARPWLLGTGGVCCAVLCCAVLCCAVLCCAVLCCAVLSHCDGSDSDQPASALRCAVLFCSGMACR